MSVAVAKKIYLSSLPKILHLMYYEQRNKSQFYGGYVSVLTRYSVVINNHNEFYFKVKARSKKKKKINKK